MSENFDRNRQWPPTNGPIPVLIRYGLIKDRSDQLPGALRTTVHVNDRNETVYTATAAFFNEKAIRCLSALSLEGFTVSIQTQNSREIRAYVSTPNPGGKK